MPSKAPAEPEWWLAAWPIGLETDPKRKNRMRRKPLCQTIAGNNCDMLIVTTF